MATTPDNDTLFASERVRVDDFITIDTTISGGYSEAPDLHRFRSEYHGSPADPDLYSGEEEYLGEIRGMIGYDFFYNENDRYDQADSISADMESLAMGALALQSRQFPRQGIIALTAVFLETAWLAKPFRGNGQNLLRTFIREMLRTAGLDHDTTVVIAQPAPMNLLTTTTRTNGALGEIHYLNHAATEYETAYKGLLAANKRSALTHRFTHAGHTYNWGLGCDF